jgi:hypothetical protein
VGWAPSAEGAGGLGGLAQEASNAVMAIIAALRHAGRERVKSSIALQENAMTLLLLEALGALLLLVFIVWWTMFSGRKKGELKEGSDRAAADSEEKREIK